MRPQTGAGRRRRFIPSRTNAAWRNSVTESAHSLKPWKSRSSAAAAFWSERPAMSSATMILEVQTRSASERPLTMARRRGANRGRRSATQTDVSTSVALAATTVVGADVIDGQRSRPLQYPPPPAGPTRFVQEYAHRFRSAARPRQGHGFHRVLLAHPDSDELLHVLAVRAPIHRDNGLRQRTYAPVSTLRAGRGALQAGARGGAGEQRSSTVVADADALTETGGRRCRHRRVLPAAQVERDLVPARTGQLPLCELAALSADGGGDVRFLAQELPASWLESQVASSPLRQA